LRSSSVLPHALADRALLSFPTRRSSDLANAVTVRGQPSAGARDRNLFAMDPTHPFIIAGPSGKDLDEYYPPRAADDGIDGLVQIDRKSTRLNSSHLGISYAVFCLKKKMC